MRRYVHWACVRNGLDGRYMRAQCWHFFTHFLAVCLSHTMSMHDSRAENWLFFLERLSCVGRALALVTVSWSALHYKPNHTYHHARPAHKKWRILVSALSFAGRASEFVDDLTRTPDERHSFLVCVNLCAHFLHAKNVSVFSLVSVDARRTSDQRQSNVRHK